MADFHLNIVTALKTVFSDNVTALTLPGAEGSFGILANHAPIVAVLKAGPAVLRRGAKETRFTITGGFLEMSDNVATLLTDRVEGIEGAE